MSRWIFLRGLSRDCRHWGAFPEIFSAANPDAEVLMLDFPGNGVRYKETSPLSVGELLEDCRQSLARQGIQGPYRLLAMSLGAMVAIEWSARYPAEIACCVLVNTSLRGLSPFHHRLRPQNYRRLLNMACAPSDTRWESTVMAMTSARHDAETLNDWINFRKAYRASATNAMRQLIAAARYRAPINAPPAKCLLLASIKDQLVRFECTQAIAKHWSLPLLTHPTAGHDLPLDDPHWVTEQIRLLESG